MNKPVLIAMMALWAASTGNTQAASYTLPVQVDYRLIKNALLTQLYKGEGHTAEVWKDKKGCSYLTLANPQVSGEHAQIKLVNQLQAQFGTKFGGQCVTLFKWQGVLHTLQQPTVNAAQSVLSLPITQITAIDDNGRAVGNDKLQDLLKRFVEPQLSDVKIDLNASRADIDKTISGFLPKENAAEVTAILNTLKFSSAKANDTGVAINLAFDATEKVLAKTASAPLSAAEQKQWQARWQEWEQLFSKAIQKASNDTQSPELRDTLTEILLESRRAMQAGLKADNAKGEDPVRVFFIQTWERLAPQLKVLAQQLPELQGLRYMTFIAATDVLYALESQGTPLGLSISSEGLRRLARMLIEGKQAKLANSPKPK